MKGVREASPYAAHKRKQLLEEASQKGADIVYYLERSSIGAAKVPLLSCYLFFTERLTGSILSNGDFRGRCVPRAVRAAKVDARLHDNFVHCSPAFTNV